MNLHSHRSQVPIAQLARWLEEDGGPTTKLFDGVSGAGEMLARAPEHAATLATESHAMHASMSWIFCKEDP